MTVWPGAMYPLGATADAEGVKLTPLERTIDEAGYHYRWVDVAFDREGRGASLTIRAPETAWPEDVDGIKAL